MFTESFSLRRVALDVLVDLAQSFVEHYGPKSDLPIDPGPPEPVVVQWPPWRPQLSHAYTENYYYVREDCQTVPGVSSEKIFKGTRLRFTGLSSWHLEHERWLMGMETTEGEKRTFMLYSAHLRPGEEIPKDPMGSGAQA